MSMLRRAHLVRKKLKEIARLEEIRASSKRNLNEDELTKFSFAAAFREEQEELEVRAKTIELRKPAQMQIEETVSSVQLTTGGSEREPEPELEPEQASPSASQSQSQCQRMIMHKTQAPCAQAPRAVNEGTTSLAQLAGNTPMSLQERVESFMMKSPADVKKQEAKAEDLAKTGMQWHDTETHKAHAILDAKIQHTNLDAKPQAVVDLTKILKSPGIVAPRSQPASTAQAKTSIQRELDPSAPPAMQGAQPGQSEDHGSVQGQGDFRRKQEVNLEREISRLRDDLA
jgi:hypothetical protein